jgi:hypothetical protein
MNKGNGVALGLSITGLVMFVVPIISLAFSIPALVIANKSAKKELSDFSAVGSWTKAARVISIVAIALTSLLMVLAFPGAYEANFG